MEIIYQHFTKASSTNDLAKAHLTTYSPTALTIIYADQQTKGRGQYGRYWESPEGNLYASFCLFVEQNKHDPLFFTHILAICTQRILKKIGIESHLKWPNDLLVDGKKIAGILCETQSLPQYLGVVIGLGLNVNTTQDQLKEIDQPATSIYLETGQESTLKTLLPQIAAEFVTLSKQFA